jgi:lipoate-protein ligase A
LERRAIRKFSGGKMLKVTVRSENRIIKEIRVTGDFFVHPEEALEMMEEALKGVPITAIPQILERRMKEGGITVVGFKLDDLINMIEACTK